ncbi:MAG: hypothetical protein IV100_23260 [Myxococcales bacterium]|nr:hypothetical protein [Myxococcales bacterium]
MSGLTRAGIAVLLLGSITSRAETEIILPPHASPGQWVFVPVAITFAAPEARCVRAEPVLHFVPTGGGPTVERRAWPIALEMTTLEAETRWASRVVKVPDLLGDYSVSASAVLLPCDAPAGGPGAPLSAAFDDLNGRLAAPGTARALVVESLPTYLAILALVALVVAAPWTAAAVARSRRALGVGLAIGTIGALGSWRYWLGGQVLFLALWLLLAVIIARAPSRDVAVTRGSVALMVASELYWGSLVNGTFWTAPVISLSVLMGLVALFGKAITRPRPRAISAFVCAQFLAVLYVCANIYKAFFLDIPAIAVAGDAGQIDRLLDSIAKVTLPTHVIAVSMPAMMLAVIAVTPRRR